MERTARVVYEDGVLKPTEPLPVEDGAIFEIRYDTPKQPKKRVLGLHPGSIWISGDFIDPLPDEFWFGNE